MNNKVSTVNKFIATVNKPIYYLSLIGLTVILIELTTTKAINMWLGYVVAMALIATIIFLEYFIAKKIKQKKNVEINFKVTKGHKVLFFVITFIIAFATSVLLAYINTKILYNSLGLGN